MMDNHLENDKARHFISIIAKVQQVTQKEYLNAKKKPIVFSSREELFILYTALKELAPQLRNRDDNIDKHHNRRLEQEKVTVKANAEFYAVNEKDLSSLTSFMIKTKAQALDSYVNYLKEICEYYEFSKNKIRYWMIFLRDAMKAVAENKIDISKELIQIKKIIELDTKDKISKDTGIEYIQDIPNKFWL